MDILKAILVKRTKLKLSTIDRPSQLLHFLCFLGFVFSFIPCLVIFSIYKKIAELLMILRHGKNFHGFVPNSDGLFTVEEEQWRNNIVILTYIRSREKTDILERVRKCFQEKVFDNPRNYRKLTSTYHRSMGYVYLVYDTYTLHDCVKPLKLDRSTDAINDNDLKRFIEENGNSSFPKNGCGTWEVFVGQKPMENDNKDGTFCYPVVLKLHHILGDGTALFATFTKTFADDPQACENLLIDKIKIMTKRREINASPLMKYLINLVKHVRMLYAAAGSLVFFLYLQKKDQNALHGRELTGEKVVSWIKEDKVELIPMVKKIKNTVPNTTFSDVLYTAITASLLNHFDRNSCAMPDRLSVGISIVMSLGNLNTAKFARMENNLGVAMLDLACGGEGPLLDILDRVRDQYAFIQTIPDKEAGYLFLNTLLEPFPLPLIASYTVPNGVTTYVTNIPGGPKIKVLDGCELEALVPFSPNRGKIGISFGIISYDDRFSFGVYGDTSLINSTEIQKIADEIVENIRILDKEATAKYSKTHR